MEDKGNLRRGSRLDWFVTGVIGTAVMIVTLYTNYAMRNQSKVEELLSCAAKHDNRRGISVADFKDLENKFYETDPRHEFAQSYTGGRLQPYIGNPAIKMRGITSWDNPNEKKIRGTQVKALKKILYGATQEELDKVINAYKK